MHRNVLVADDDLAIRNLVKEYLTDPYTTCIEVGDGAAAVRLAGQCRPDAVLLDVSMPVLDGFEACRSLKADPATRRIPVLFLTSQGEVPDKVRGLDLGANDYITKPFDADELTARVRSLLRVQRDLHQADSRAARDAETGLFNRAYLTHRLEAELAASRRRCEPLACCVAAVEAGDGSPAGEAVLRAAAANLLAVLRREDVACRYDDHTVAVLGFVSNRAAAVALADRVRSALSPAAAGDPPPVVNVGVALSHHSLGDSLVWHAHEAMRHARHSDPGSIQFGGELTELYLADQMVN